MDQYASYQWDKVVTSFLCPNNIEKLIYAYLQDVFEIERKGQSRAGWQKQLMILTKRSFLNMTRDWGYYWIRILVYIALSISIGTIFFDVGASRAYTDIMSRVNCGGFITGFMTIMAVGGFPSLIEEIKVDSHIIGKTKRHYTLIPVNICSVLLQYSDGISLLS